MRQPRAGKRPARARRARLLHRPGHGGPARRVLVVGSTGAGKSTLARELGQRWGLPFHEMDALFFSGPGWAVDPRFAQRVGALVREPAWIFDSWGQPEVRALLWEHADTVVWLDLPRRVVMRRVLWRSLLRTVRGERIFGGNRERLREWFDADHPAWSAWSGHARRRAGIARLLAAPRPRPPRVVQVTDRRAARLVAGLGPTFEQVGALGSAPCPVAEDGRAHGGPG